MKKYLIYYFVIFTISQIASGVTLLRVEGTFETVIEGDWPLVGESFEVEIPYEVTDPVSLEGPNRSSFMLFNQTILRYGSQEFVLDLTVGGVRVDEDSGSSSISFGPQSQLGGPSGHFIGLIFQSDEPFWGDMGVLPASLEDWRLDEAEFMFKFTYESIEGAGTYVVAESSSYTHLSITTIPEPSRMTVLLMSLLLAGLRRRR